MFKRIILVSLSFALFIISMGAVSAEEPQEQQLSCTLNVTKEADGWITAKVDFSGNVNHQWIVLWFGDGSNQGWTDESSPDESFVVSHQYDIDATPNGEWTLSVGQLGAEFPCSESYTVSWKKGAPEKPVVTSAGGAGPEFYDCVLSNAPLGLTNEMAAQLYVNQPQNTGMVRVVGDNVVIGPLKRKDMGKTNQLHWDGTGDGSAMFELIEKDNCVYVTP